MPQILSEEELPPASPEHKGKDMHTWMNDEDERRARLFHSTNAAPPRTPPKVTHGANVCFEMAQRSTTSVYCCGACGAWLVRPQDLVRDEEIAVDVSLDDSAATLWRCDR